MKQSLLAALVFLSAIHSHAQPMPVKIRPMRDYYFTGENMRLKNSINCFAITDRKTFEKFFGATKRADTPSFSKEIMLVLLMPESNKDSKLKFEKVDMKAGNFIEVYCTADINEGKLPYKTYPIATCTIPIVPGVSIFNFYQYKNMKLLQSVTL